MSSNGFDASSSRPRRSERKIIDKYKHLINQTKQSGLEDDNILDQSLEGANIVFKDVSKPREAIYDSTLVNLQSHILKQKTQSLHTNLTVFKPDEFVVKLKASCEKRIFNTSKKPTPVTVWTSLGQKSKSVFNTPPPYHYLYGTFDPGAVELKRKYRKIRNKDELSNVVQKPKVINAKEAQSEEQQATQEAERILSILIRLYQRCGGPLCYFEFVTNPESFSETVENMFYVSMLVMEASVKIYSDSQGLPVIEPIADTKISETKLYGKYSQSILAISEPEWKEIIKEFNITKPKIPTRRKT